MTTIDWAGAERSVYADQWVVSLADDAASASVFAALNGLGDGVAYELVDPLTALLTAPGVSLPALDAWAAGQAGVLHVEPNLVIHSAVTPNDPKFSSLWGLHNTGQSTGTVDADIDAPEAWSITTGSSDVVIAVIDSGIDYTHPDLAGNMWVNTGEIAGNGVDDDGNGFIDDVHGWDFVDEDSDPDDEDSHGTHVAGTIGAVGNNNVGVTGVAWNVRLMALRFLEGGSGSVIDAVQAINYATKMKQDFGVNVVASNNSWGEGGNSFALQRAIEKAGDAGILFVAAAGNDGNNLDNEPDYPSSFDEWNIISVAATDRKDRLAGFSNYGLSTVDLAAPGSAIHSTLPNNKYGNKSGTSMATPHVTGAIALLASAFPSATPAELKDAILASVDPVSALAGKTATGGRLNVYAAMLELGAPANTAPVLTPIADQWRFGSGTFNVTINATDPNGDTLSYSAGIVGDPFPVPATLFVSGNVLTIEPVATFHGEFDVSVSVSDGFETVSDTFNVLINNPPPPKVIDVAINGGDTQRSMVTSMAFTFDMDVNVSPAALVLTDQVTGAMIDAGDLAVNYDAVTATATWSFPGLPGGSLPDGNYFASLDETLVTSTAGAELGGGPGGPGAASAIELFRFFGDADADRDVDALDLFAFRGTYQKVAADAGFDANFDSDADGDVDALDLFRFRGNYQQVLDEVAAAGQEVTTQEAADPQAVSGQPASTSTVSTVQPPARRAVSTPAADHLKNAWLTRLLASSAVERTFKIDVNDDDHESPSEIARRLRDARRVR